MPTDFDGRYHDDVIITYVNEVPYGRRFIHCCPGDWPAIVKTIDNIDEWSVRRCGSCIIAFSPPSGPAVDRIWDQLGRDNLLSVPTEGGA